MKNSKKSNNIGHSKKYMRYTGLAFEMMANIMIFTWLGKKIDSKINIKFPIFMSIFAVLSIVISIYLLIKKINNLNEP